MDDQFNGRTDDDLFSDDFEPALSPEQHAAEPVVPQAKAPVVIQKTDPEPQTKPQTKPQTQQPAKSPKPAAPAPQPPKSLAQSRHARPAQNTKQTKPATAKEPTAETATATAPPSQTVAKKPIPTGPAKENAPANKAGGDSRLGSGANPRTKLTETELADKMEKMRILAAEKTRKFEEEMRDESEHAAAYARGMEEARKRRVVEEEKRRRGDEEKKRLDDERAKNRERKLQAMGMKEGGWDEGKQERLDEEERRGFRSAHGGVRGARGLGLSGSRFADAAEDRGESFGGDRGARGRGRGRGGRGRGGGRGGFGDGLGDREGNNRAPGRQSQAQPQSTPKAEDFPALPLSAAPKIETTGVLPPLPVDIPLSPPIGKWDDEVAAMAEKNGG